MKNIPQRNGIRELMEHPHTEFPEETDIIRSFKTSKVLKPARHGVMVQGDEGLNARTFQALSKSFVEAQRFSVESVQRWLDRAPLHREAKNLHSQGLDQAKIFFPQFPPTAAGRRRWKNALSFFESAPIAFFRCARTLYLVARVSCAEKKRWMFRKQSKQVFIGDALWNVQDNRGRGRWFA